MASKQMKRIPYYLLIAIVIGACADAAQDAQQEANQTEDTQPASPEKFSATPKTNQIVLNWTEAESVVGYDLFWNDTGDVTTDSDVINVTSSPYTHRDLANKQIYYYRIRAVNPTGKSPLSDEIFAIPDDYKILYVSATALDDSGNGLTPEKAKLTITSAIDAATAPADIRVNEGLYTVRSDQGTHIKLKNGVSLYGGYNADFSERDASRYISTITDAPGPPASSTQHQAIEGGPGVTMATIVDGFSINGSLLQPVTIAQAIVLSDGASPIIQNNTIFAGYAKIVIAITIYKSSPIIQNNIISALNVQPHTAISMEIGTVTIRNNTIYGGNGISANLMGLGIYNNIIISNFTCIASRQKRDKILIYNNNLFGCSTAYQNAGTYYTAQEIELATGGTGNVSVDPLFLSAENWHLSVSTPPQITQGGLNGRDEGWNYFLDKDGVTRPSSGNPWAMGAYEP
jgi:Fibronectin type III domain/Protein of unknown function (DUF1565)